MEELERFKKEISLLEYAPTYDYTELDRNQSSRTCVVLRRQVDDGKIAVSRDHDGHWVYYDFRCGKGGSILDFVMQHTGCNLGQIRKELRVLYFQKVFLDRSIIGCPYLPPQALRESTGKKILAARGY